MIYHLSAYLQSYFSALNVVHYVSFRAIAALLSTLIFSFLFGDWFISKSKQFFRSRSREWTPENHKQKDNMPTMGGLFIIAIVAINMILWCNLADPRVWIFLVCISLFGAIGLWDDWRKIVSGRGISSSCKFVFQWLSAAIVTGLSLKYIALSTTVLIPFYKNIQPNLGWGFAIWAMFIMVAMSNAVNLTDGLDGLAIGSLIPNFALFALLAYISGHYMFALYLHIPFTASAEVAVIGAILVGASLGFLWYNTYPAQIFMGDVGSLALGAGLALMALMAKQELLLPIAGGLFVLETVSVMLQVFSVRYRGKRIFKMAPIHHHFELIGWQESKITVRFGIISLILCLLALITLKIR